MKMLLPSREEARKLLFEAWKYIVLTILAALALVIDPIRESLLNWFDIIAQYASTSHLCSGLVLITLYICGFFTAFCVFYYVFRWLGPGFNWRFVQGEYNGAIWRWRWKNGRVVKESMRAMCVRCGTELDIRIRGGFGDSIHTHLYCTNCNMADVIGNCEDIKDHIWRKIEADARNHTWRDAIERIPRKYRA